MANAMRMNNQKRTGGPLSYSLYNYKFIYPYNRTDNNSINTILADDPDSYKKRIVEMQWALNEITRGSDNTIDMTKIFQVQDYYTRALSSSADEIECSFQNSKKSCLALFERALSVARESKNDGEIELIKQIKKDLTNLAIDDTNLARQIVIECNELFSSRMDASKSSDILVKFYYYLDTPAAYASLAYGTEVFSRGKVLEEFFKNKSVEDYNNLTSDQQEAFNTLSNKYKRGEISALKNLVTKYLREQLINKNFTVTGINIQGLLDFTSKTSQKKRYTEESGTEVKKIRDSIVNNFKNFYTFQDGVVVSNKTNQQLNADEYQITSKGNVKINGLLISQEILANNLTNKSGIATKGKGNIVNTANTPTNLNELVKKVLKYADTQKYQDLINNQQKIVNKLKIFINQTQETRIITQFSNSGISGVLGELKGAISLSKLFQLNAEIVGTEKTKSGSQAGDIKFVDEQNVYYAQIKNSIELKNTIDLYGVDITLQSTNALNKYFPIEYIEPLRFFVASYFAHETIQFPTTINDIQQAITNGLIQRIQSSLLQFYRIEAFDWLGQQNSFFIMYNYLVPTPCLMVLINQFLNDGNKVKATVNVQFNNLNVLERYSKTHNYKKVKLGDNSVGPGRILQKNKIHQAPLKINLARFSLR